MVFAQNVGDVEAIASDAGHIYAGTDNGVFVSADNGRTWVQKNNGLANLEIFSFTITPMGTVLAGTEGGGIFRSTDFGENWQAANAGLPDTSNIPCLTSDRFGNIFAGHSEQGVFYSSDDGQHWSQRNTGMGNESIFSLTITPSDSVYAGSGSGGAGSIPIIFASPDLGLHWDTSYGGLASGDEVFALASDSSGDVFAGTYKAKRLRLFADSTAWEDISPFASSSLDEVKSLACDGDVLYAGFFGSYVGRSYDRGSTWKLDTAGLTDPKIYSLTVTPQGYLFAGTFLAEVFRTTGPLGVGKGVPNSTLALWPEPFRSSALLSFALAKGGPVHVALYDALGRDVCEAFSRTLPEGPQRIAIDPELSAGVYTLVLTTPDGVYTRSCSTVR